MWVADSLYLGAQLHCSLQGAVLKDVALISWAENAELFRIWFMDNLGADAMWTVKEGYLMLSIFLSHSLLADWYFLREIKLIKVSL